MTGPPRKVLVTGATGFVGGAVARALLDAGRHVTALVRDPASPAAAALAAAGADLHTGDMLRPATYVPLVGSADAVVHAAQLRVTGRLTPARVRRMQAADATMTRALAGACRAAGNRLLYTAGAFVYGDHGTRWISESTPHTPAPLGAGHAAGAARLAALTDRGLDAVVACCGFVYGNGGNFRTAFLDRIRTGRLLYPGDGRNLWSCVHVDDLAAGYLAALDHGRPGATYHLADDQPVPLGLFTHRIAYLAGVRHVTGLPRTVASLALGRPVAASLTTSYRLSNRRARDELGWTPAHPSVDSGLPAVLAAYAAPPGGVPQDGAPRTAPLRREPDLPSPRGEAGGSDPNGSDPLLPRLPRQQSTRTDSADTTLRPPGGSSGGPRPPAVHDIPDQEGNGR